MENSTDNNENLENENADNSAERSNMPDQQVPRHHSDENNEKNKVKSDAGHLSRDFGYSDFGAEEARADAEKGNKGHAGNMPNTEEK